MYIAVNLVTNYKNNCQVHFYEIFNIYYYNDELLPNYSSQFVFQNKN